MVERLKIAIDKARNSRKSGQRKTSVARGSTGRVTHDAAIDEHWDRLETIVLDPDLLTRSRLVTHDKSDVAHAAFDMLRTRMLKVFRDNGWKRVGITSPTKGCGKTLVSANMAFSCARQPDLRTVLMDMDLKRPGLASTLGRRRAPPMAHFLTGRAPLSAHFVRPLPNLAVAMNGERVRESAELIQDECTANALDQVVSELSPDIVIIDLPPVMVADDVVAMLPMLDCVLLVAAAGQTKAREIEECERLFNDQTSFLGVLLNKVARGAVGNAYYDYE